MLREHGSYQPLSREAVLYVVAEALRDPMALELTAADEAADAEHDETDVAQVRAAAVLAQLAQHGVIMLHWRKWEEHNWLEAVDLVPQ